MPARRVAVPAACLALALLALAGRLLPADLAAGPAAFALLVAPGLAAWRAFAPRRPLDLAVDVPAVVAFGAGVHAVALAVTFASHRSLVLDLWLIGLATAALALVATRGPLPPLPRDEARAAALVVLAAVPVGIACARLVRITVDLPFHTGRVRKLQDFGGLSVNALDELVRGGPHPGYAFPLWHELVATAGNVAGVQADQAIRGAVLGLVPLAALAAAALARAALGAGPWPGAAAAFVALAGLGIGRHGGGYVGISTPAEAAADLLLPVLLALLVAFGARRAWPEAVAVASAAAAISAVHATYLVFALLIAAGALAADALAARRLPPWRPVAAGLALLLAPFAAYAAWVAPIARQVATAERTRLDALIPYYGDFVGTVGGLLYVRPGHLAPVSTVGLAALVAAPAARYLGRRAALVLGGLAAILACGLVPPLPDALARAVGIAQSHRLGLLLPGALLVTAAAAGLAARVGDDRRRRAAALAAALVLGVAAIPLDAHLRSATALVAAGACALAAAAVLVRPRSAAAPAGLTALLAVAVAAPSAIYRAPGVERLAGPTPPSELPPDLIAALRRLPRRSVLISDRFTAYTVTAYADVLVYMVPVRNVADTRANDVRARFRENALMMDPRTPEAQRRRDLRRSGIGYVLVERDDRSGAGRYFPTATGYRTVFADTAYVLLRAPV